MIEVLNLSALVLRNSAKKIFQAFILILFFGSIFILLGKQLYKGVLTQKCVFLPPRNVSDMDYQAYVSNSSHWLEDKIGYYLCGNSTGSRPCPTNYTCLKGANVNSYVSHFNFYGSSVITISQLMTLHFWQELYQRMLLTAGTLHVTYFVLAFYSFLYSSGLILALITRTYKTQLKEFEISEKTSSLVLREHNQCDAPKGIAKSPSCKSYELFSSQVLHPDRIERQVSEAVDCTSQSEKSLDSDRCLRDRVTESKHLREAVRCQLASERSNDSSSGSPTRRSGIEKIFRSIQKYIKSYIFGFCTELFLMAIIVLFLCAAILRFSHRLDPHIYIIFYRAFAVINAWEVCMKLVALGPQLYFQDKWNGFDAIVLIMGGSEIIFFGTDHSMMFVFKAFKLVRVMVCCNTCQYLKCVIDASLFMFLHPTSVLLVFMCICIVSGMQLYGIEYFHSEDRFPDQDPPRWYFKDCYSSFLLVFCMLCGDWKQPMVNTVLFTSCASDLLMLIFVLFGNLVVMNLFLGVVFYTFFYKTYPKNSCSKGNKLENAFQVILHGHKKVHNPKVEFKEKKRDDVQSNVNASSCDIISDSHESFNQPFRRDKRCRGGTGFNSRSNREAVEMAAEESSSEYMADCCPTLCYFCCSFCRADENPVLWQNWADVRCRLYCFVERRAFRVTVFVVILVSIVVLIITRSHGSSNPQVAQIIRVMDPCIFVLFAMEMFLKWMAYGLQKYFKSHLGRLEFFIVLVYLVDLLSIKFFDGQKNIFKALRSFRLLSVTSLLKSYQETVPLPMKRNVSIIGSVNASKESLLHLRRMECNHFLGRHCRYKPTGSGEIFQMDWNVTEVPPPDSCGSRMRRVELNNVTDFRSKSSPVEASHCLPDMFYNLFAWCREDCSFWHGWERTRTKILMLVSSNYFAFFHGFIITASCLMLAVEASFALEKPALVMTMSCYVDRVFGILFFIQIMLKCFGFGLREYFTSIFCIVEFLISVASLLYVLFDEVQVGNFQILKLVRVFLLLYLCKVLGFNKQAKYTLASLSQAFPSYFVVFFFCSFLWLIFALLGVAMFEQKLWKCVDENGEPLNISLYQNKDNCVERNMTYENPSVNFDSVEMAYIALLQVATLQDWISFVTDIMDNTRDNQIKNEIYTATFFPLFIMFSTFLTVNFFAGVTCWFFNDLKKESEKGANSHTEALYKAAVLKMESTKLKRTVPQPKLHFQAFLYRMVMSDNFEIAGFVFIGLHMLLIALDMYDPDPSEMFALAMTELNVFFIVIFTVEIVIKMLALRHYYFLSIWNHFDVVVLALCICGAIYQDLFSSPMLPAMLRLIRFLKCTRYLRRHARGMLPLIYSLYRSIPAFFALLILQFIAMFIYSVFGVHLFREVPQSWDISGELSFATFPKGMLLLFQMSTLAGWVDVLEALSQGQRGMCCAALFVVSYIVVVYYIIIKTHLIVMLDSFDAAMYEYENILLKEDYEMFVEVWQKFDTNGNGIIKFHHLPDLLDLMEEPFHFCRPNRFLIASLNIPLYEGELVFYADLMDALTRDFMGRHRAHFVDPRDNAVPGLLDAEGTTLRKVGSSLWRQRQNHCAHVIQRAWKRHVGRGEQGEGGDLARSPVFYSEVRLTVEGDRVDTFLTAEVRSCSHASV